jgi:site-specific recombinase
MNKLVRISNVITDRVNSLLNREPNLTLLFMALYISEGWYDQWFRTGDVHAKARAIVLFDRVITDRHQLRNIPENSED